MKAIKAKVNLAIDLAIGLAFLVEAVTGFVLAVVVPHGGYQGGRNAAYGEAYLVSRDVWLLLHDWFAILMVLGVLAHVVMHWRWILCMVKKTWTDAWGRSDPRQRPPSGVTQECPL